MANSDLILPEQDLTIYMHNLEDVWQKSNWLANLAAVFPALPDTKLIVTNLTIGNKLIALLFESWSTNQPLEMVQLLHLALSYPLHLQGFQS